MTTPFLASRTCSRGSSLAPGRLTQTHPVARGRVWTCDWLLPAHVRSHWCCQLHHWHSNICNIPLSSSRGSMVGHWWPAMATVVSESLCNTQNIDSAFSAFHVLSHDMNSETGMWSSWQTECGTFFQKFIWRAKKNENNWQYTFGNSKFKLCHR